MTPTDAARRAAIGALTTIHVLGVLGAPVAAKIHVFQPGANAHQNFHVIWEACKYATASLFAIGLVLGPVNRGERWARNLLLVGSIILFGGVFFSEMLTKGGPAIDFWAYGSFLVISLIGIAIVAATETPRKIIARAGQEPAARLTSTKQS